MTGSSRETSAALSSLDRQHWTGHLGFLALKPVCFGTQSLSQALVWKGVKNDQITIFKGRCHDQERESTPCSRSRNRFHGWLHDCIGFLEQKRLPEYKHTRNHTSPLPGSRGLNHRASGYEQSTKIWGTFDSPAEDALLLSKP